MSRTLLLSEAAEAVLPPFILDGPVPPGHRRLRRAAISSPWSDSAWKDSAWDDSIDIPIYVESLETLRFVGFNKAAAKVIHDRYHSAIIELGTMPFDFFDFMTDYLKGRSGDAYRVDHDWEGVLEDLGMRKRVRTGILNPDFDDIRLMKSARDWALETIEDGWIFLTGMDDAVKRNGEKLRIKRSKSGPEVAAEKRSEMETEAGQ